jgi:hypothetical protein
LSFALLFNNRVLNLLNQSFDDFRIARNHFQEKAVRLFWETTVSLPMLQTARVYSIMTSKLCLAKAKSLAQTFDFLGVWSRPPLPPPSWRLAKQRGRLLKAEKCPIIHRLTSKYKKC